MTKIVRDSTPGEQGTLGSRSRETGGAYHPRGPPRGFAWSKTEKRSQKQNHINRMAWKVCDTSFGSGERCLEGCFRLRGGTGGWSRTSLGYILLLEGGHDFLDTILLMVEAKESGRKGKEEAQ